MPRSPIVLSPETVNHVTQRATDSETFVLDRIDRDAIVALVRKTVDRHELELQDYCVMSNHLHLLVRAPKANLPRAMQYLGARMVERFNRRYCRRGHLVQAPYGAKPVLTEGHSLWVRAYIALNPVFAGLCDRPEQWAWSGYGGKGQLVPPPSRETRELVRASLVDGLGPPPGTAT
jgi:REP element-mobilizing transposase RayT